MRCVLLESGLATSFGSFAANLAFPRIFR